MTIYLFPPLPRGLKRLPGSRRTAVNASLSILLRMGFTGPASRQAAGELLPRLSTLTCITGGISLLHFPWSRLHRMLSGILSYGARTFLVFSPRSPGPLNLIQHKAALRSFRIPQSLFRWKPAWPARWAIPYCSLNILYHPILP